MLVLHGGGGNAENSVGAFKLEDAADRAGYIVVYPEGLGRKFMGHYFASWNAGRCCQNSSNAGADDIGYISKLIDVLIRNHKADPARIYVTGHSNGAMMAYRLACELSGKIAAIAPTGAVGVIEPCLPSRSVPVLHIHGTADPCAPYDGGLAGGCLGDYLERGFGVKTARVSVQCGSVPDYVAHWRDLDGLRNTPGVDYRRGNADCRSYRSNNGNREVTLCSIEGQGHELPNGHPMGPCTRGPSRLCSIWRDVMGPNVASIDYPRMLFDFFNTH